MLALLFSVAVAVYLLGPDLVARWLLGFVVPRKALVQTRTEEIGRSVLWALVPLGCAYLWSASQGSLQAVAGRGQLGLFFAGLYSDKIFEANLGSWYASAAAFARWNWCLIWRLYLIVLMIASGLASLTFRFGAIRRRMPDDRWRRLLATVILPRVAEWHVLLSDMLLPGSDLELYADVLTGSGLYRGSVQDKVLGVDGNLRSLTLGNPQRFQREQFDKAKDEDETVLVDDFWRDIPGNLFVVLAADMKNVNLRYERTQAKETFRPTRDEKAVLRKLLQQLAEDEG